MSEITEMSRDEIVSLIDAAARQRVGMSAKQLLSRHRSGQLKDDGPVIDLLVFADLLPDDDPIFAHE